MLPPVPVVVVGAAALMIACEAVLPGRSWPRVRWWWLRAAALNGAQAGMVFVAGWAWDGWLRAHRPWSAEALGPVLGAVLGYFVETFVYYWWHRARHASPLLWRLFHQVHHSPQRIEVITSFYKHPFEIATNGLIPSVVFYLVCGLSIEAATGATLLTGLAELFYHWNVPTPHGLGYFIQRPESHCVHHEEGVHSFNYGDLPIWDMMFGTFRNPRRFEARCGFGPEGEARLGEMLLLKDVTRPSSPRGRRAGVRGCHGGNR